MAHRVLSNSQEVAEYEQYLDDGWPERDEVAQHLCERLNGSYMESLRVLELACGPGALAENLLSSTRTTAYTGVDISPASLAFAQERLSDFASTTRWLQADLNEGAWMEEIDGPFEAVVSMQSIHDLGGEQEIRRIFGLVNTILTPGGTFVYADLLRSSSDPPDANPGRFHAFRHKELLANAGFGDVSCTLQMGGFGCFEAHAV